MRMTPIESPPRIEDHTVRYPFAPAAAADAPVERTWLKNGVEKYN